MSSEVLQNNLLKKMCLLKNSNELLLSPFNLITSIKSFDVSTLHASIPHQKLKSRLASTIWNSLSHKSFVMESSDFKNKYTEDSIINMQEFLVDNIFVVFGRKIFQKIVGIPMGTNSSPLLADIFQICTHKKRNSYSLCSQLKRNS